MRIALVACPNPELLVPTAHFQQGLLYVGSALRLAGHEVEIVDLRAKTSVGPGDIPEADMVGISATTGEIGWARQIASVAQAKGAKTILGGAHATFATQDCLDDFDFVVDGDGEMAVLKVLKLQRDREDGIWGKCSGARGVFLKYPLPSLSGYFPDWSLIGDRGFSRELFTGAGYGQGPLAAGIISSRGCGFHCLEADTRVQLASGQLRRIKDIQVGDMVRSLRRSAWVTGCVTAAKQTSPSRDIIHISTSNGFSIGCTPDHLLLTPDGWREAGELGIGDELATGPKTIASFRCRVAEASTTDDRRQPGKAPRSQREDPVSLESEPICRCRTSPNCRSDENPGGQRTAKASDERRMGFGYQNGGELPWPSALRRRACRSSPAYYGQSTHEQSRHEGENAAIAAEQCRVASTNSRKDAPGQSHEVSERTSASLSVYAETGLSLLRPGKATMARRENHPTCCHTDTETGCQRTHESTQPYEESGDRSQGKDHAAVADVLRPQGVLEPLAEETNWTKQTRGTNRGASAAARIQVCRRWEVLDRTLPQRQMSQPRLHLQASETEDLLTLPWSILAPGSTSRYRGNERLPGDELEGVHNTRAGFAGFGSGRNNGQDLVEWAKITNITHGHRVPVYDIEVWPHHNFVANGIIVHNCSYCRSERDKVRLRPIPEVVAEIGMLKAEYGITHFRFYDENFTNPKPRSVELCEALTPLNIHIRAHTRSDAWDDELASAFKKAGGEEMGIGFEVASDHVLEKIRKQETVAQHREAVRVCKRHGIICKAFWMVGLSGQREKEIQDIKNFMLEERPEKCICSLFSPYPGSDVWAHPENYGVSFIERDFSKYWNFPSWPCVGYEDNPAAEIWKQYLDLQQYLT